MRGAVLIGGLLIAGPAAAQGPGEVELVIVHKAARTLELVAQGRVVRVFRGLQFGDPRGPKRFQGDRRTPEGRYLIDYGNDASAYHLSLHISYPNAADRAFARAARRAPGGLIFLHGQPNDYGSARASGDWTDGCIALSNAEIEELWDRVADGTPIEIDP